MYGQINSRPSFANINSRGSAQLDARSCNHVSHSQLGEIVSMFQVYFSFPYVTTQCKRYPTTVCECLRHAGTHIHTHKIAAEIGQVLGALAQAFDRAVVPTRF